MPKAAARLRLARVSCHIRPRTAALGEARTPQSASRSAPTGIGPWLTVEDRATRASRRRWGCMHQLEPTRAIRTPDC